MLFVTLTTAGYGCGDDGAMVDGGPDGVDARDVDAAGADGSTPDAAPPDAMPPDAVPPDAMPPDAMPPDAMPPDAMLPDAMPPDAVLPDAMPVPDAAPAVCGNGYHEPGEECDDGNTVDGDGCSADCQTATCLVPVTHPDPDSAVADIACDTVYIYSGTYPVTPMTVDRDLVVGGVGAEPVVLSGAAFRLTAAAITVVLRDFTIANHGDSAIAVQMDAALTLEDMIIRDGVVGGFVLTARGGAIDGVGGSLTLVRSTLRDNRVLADADVAESHGGGIYWGGGTLTLRDGSVVADNLVQAYSVAPVIAEARAYGGGISAIDTDVTVEEGSQVTGNVAEAGAQDVREARGGGIHVTGSGSVSLLSASVVGGNVVHGRSVAGGGIYSTTGLVVAGQAVIENNRVEAVDPPTSIGSPRGGGAAVGGDVTITDSRITGNQVLTAYTGDAWGGGIYKSGGGPSVSLTVTGSEISGNLVEVSYTFFGGYATAYGAAIYMANSAAAVVDSTLAGNVARLTGGATPSYADAAGGAMYTVAADVTLDRSTLAGNLATSPSHARGGACYFRVPSGSRDLVVVNSTLSGNAVTSGDMQGRGGAIASSSGRVLSSNATITDNTASDTGGGVYLASTSAMKNTIVAGNSAAVENDCHASAAVDSGGYNLIEDVTGCTMTGDTGSNITGVSAQLSPLAGNGGPTDTHALGAASPALDAGDPAGCSDHAGAPLTTDQRGEPRPAGPICDIGAYEAQP